MANTYTWFVDSLDCIPSLEEQTNVVSAVHWRVVGTSDIIKQTIIIPVRTITDENGIVTTLPEQTINVAYSSSTQGTQPLTYTAGSPFTPYSGLTQETVLQWVQLALGNEQVTAIQTNLDNQIVNLINPPIMTPTLPWNN